MFGYIYYAYLDTVPVTNRTRWIATSPKWEEELGHQEYKKMLAHFKKQGQVLPPDHRAYITVKRVGSRIAQAAEKFAKTHEMAFLSKAPFTYTVIRSDQANAFVLPGNHVFVFTGLFKYIQNEDDLGNVIAHEASHCLARHAGEKISGSFVTNLFARLSLLIDPSGGIFAIFLPATNLFRDLPHSRTQETEADQIGVYLAAEACIDPRAAKRVFAAMKKEAENSSSPPEFLSTHPSHYRRISNFDKWLPDAMAIFRGDAFSDGDRCSKVREQMSSARRQAAYEATAKEQGGVP
jgi:predicted Zn-dependent protease